MSKIIDKQLTEEEIRSSVLPEHVASPKFKQLIISYETAFEIPEAERIIKCVQNQFGDLIYETKENFSIKDMVEVYIKGLSALNMPSKQYIESPRLSYKSNIISVMKNNIENRKE